MGIMRERCCSMDIGNNSQNGQGSGRNGKKKVELLAPAGGMEAFRGALNAGADAVYLAGQQFGARAYAGNFSEEELLQVLQRAHMFGVRIYLTVNTLTRQEELPELSAFVSRIYEGGLDGVIVQDLGVAAALRERCPGLELHASTQMSVMGREAVRFLKGQGFVRVVPARELSLQEIRELKKEGLEIESFIHGAMCYSYSGRCLMSSFLGGRSGNRGRCAGTCRLPYQILQENGMPLGKDGTCYPISMKDMCVLKILPELIDAGIDSFKIEGRMKKPEYVAGTVAVYRKYIDRFYQWDAEGRKSRWSIDPEDLQELNSLYIRSDLCEGYYHEYNGRNMVTIHEPGYRGADPALLERIRAQYLEKDRKRTAAAKAVIRVGEPARMEILLLKSEADTGKEQSNESAWKGKAKGPLVQEARSRALTEEDIRNKLSKTGDSPIVFDSLEIETDGNAFLPVSALGELRRNAVDDLLQKMTKNHAADIQWAVQDEQSETAEYAGIMAPAVNAVQAESAGTRGGENAVSGSERAEQRECTSQTSFPRILVMLQSEEQLDAVRHWICVQERAGQKEISDQLCLILDGEMRDLAGHPGSADSNQQRNDEKNFREKIQNWPTRIMAALPYIMRKRDLVWLEEFYYKNHRNFYGFITRSLEELEFLKEKEYDGTVLADSMLYVWNQKSAEVLRKAGPERADLHMLLPVELGRRELEDTFRRDLQDKVLMVYGRVPLMLTANCLQRTGSGCSPDCSRGFLGLQDRTGAIFPVRTECSHCQNIIYNSVPTSLHKCMEDELIRSCESILISLTTENGSETAAVLDAFAGTQAAREFHPEAFTYGHYRKGAL